MEIVLKRDNEIISRFTNVIETMQHDISTLKDDVGKIKVHLKESDQKQADTIKKLEDSLFDIKFLKETFISNRHRDIIIALVFGIIFIIIIYLLLG